MTMGTRDKRALMVLGGVAVVGAIYWLTSSSPSTTTASKAAIPAESVERAENRLAHLRKVSAALPGKEAVLRQVTAELNDREKGLIVADTAAQAQAQLLQVIRRVAAKQTPPLEFKQVELAQPQKFGDAYGLVTVSVSIDCRTDELVNLLTELTQQPELVATDEIHMGSAHPKHKNMVVRLTFSGVVPRRLIPERKGMFAF